MLVTVSLLLLGASSVRGWRVCMQDLRASLSLGLARER